MRALFGNDRIAALREEYWNAMDRGGKDFAGLTPEQVQAKLSEKITHIKNEIEAMARAKGIGLDNYNAAQFSAHIEGYDPVFSVFTAEQRAKTESWLTPFFAQKKFPTAEEIGAFLARESILDPKRKIAGAFEALFPDLEAFWERYLLISDEGSSRVNRLVRNARDRLGVEVVALDVDHMVRAESLGSFDSQFRRLNISLQSMIQQRADQSVAHELMHAYFFRMLTEGAENPLQAGLAARKIANREIALSRIQTQISTPLAEGGLSNVYRNTMAFEELATHAMDASSLSLRATDAIADDFIQFFGQAYREFPKNVDPGNMYGLMIARLNAKFDLRIASRIQTHGSSLVERKLADQLFAKFMKSIPSEIPNSKAVVQNRSWLGKLVRIHVLNEQALETTRAALKTLEREITWLKQNPTAPFDPNRMAAIGLNPAKTAMNEPLLQARIPIPGYQYADGTWSDLEHAGFYTVDLAPGNSAGLRMESSPLETATALKSRLHATLKACEKTESRLNGVNLDLLERVDQVTYGDYLNYHKISVALRQHMRETAGFRKSAEKIANAKRVAQMKKIKLPDYLKRAIEATGSGSIKSPVVTPVPTGGGYRPSRSTNEEDSD